MVDIYSLPCRRLVRSHGVDLWWIEGELCTSTVILNNVYEMTYSFEGEMPMLNPAIDRMILSVPCNVASAFSDFHFDSATFNLTCCRLIKQLHL